MFNKLIYAMFFFFVILFNVTAIRKTGSMVVFNNATNQSVRLYTSQVKAIVNDKIGEKAIDFLSNSDSPGTLLVEISKDDSQAHLLSMPDESFLDKELIVIKTSLGSKVLVAIRKKSDGTLSLERKNSDFVFGLYMHSSGDYCLLMANSIESYLKKKQELLTVDFGMPQQWSQCK